MPEGDLLVLLTDRERDVLDAVLAAYVNYEARRLLPDGDVVRGVLAKLRSAGRVQ
jgi:hypothetical protein